ncbi:hypothetical protein P1P91_05890 [Halomonas piscis]|uniref:Uncharacterized protein n=1 Tax=Halomonas piscis TaxID=3031727 RepID=A0ABY9Z234_9GAMM|nr:hypothetical protein [Halomonas piscis]WNK21204.1 hypothetical protein P1P91_05890 [Halomonas piscis]
MTDLINPEPSTASYDMPVIPHDTRQALMLQLERYEHLLFEPMSQADLDSLYALYDHWQATLGDSPESIALSDALDDFISAGIEDDGQDKDGLTRAYMALFQTVREGGE